MVQRAEWIAGTLSSTVGDVFPVSLRLTTKSLFDEGAAIVDRAIDRVDLVGSEVPDGEYVLEYFLGKPFHEHVRIKLGVLWAA